MTNIIAPLADINVPPRVKIEVTSDFESLLADIGRRSMMGYAGDVFFGTAFIQGSRLQFTTAMPVQKMLDVSKIDRSRKKDQVPTVVDHSNRPQEPAHSKQVRSYLLSTACIGEKFILPAFTFNYGVGLGEDDPDVTLILFATAGEGTNAWPAILLLPQGAKLDTTDGAHRRSQIDEILGGKTPDVQKDALKRNAVDVKIVFEDSRDDSHQDFADCGKAKAIPKSLVTTFDVRDRRNKRSRELVISNDFLSAYVDATASNVNLSSKSRMIWSMSAVRMFIAHIIEHHPHPSLSDEQKTEGVERFIAALVRHMPELHALDKARKEPGSSSVTTGSLRDLKGGNVALRGVGMAIFARAFLHCKEYGLDFESTTSKLAKIDWHLLRCERNELPGDQTFAEKVRENAQPIWAHLLVIGESRYRVSSSSSDADIAWQKIREQVLEEDQQAA